MPQRDIMNESMYSFSCTDFKFVKEDDEEEIHRMTIVIGDRFMNRIFISKEELKKCYKQFNKTLHDMNHKGTGYNAGFTHVPSDLSYEIR